MIRRLRTRIIVFVVTLLAVVQVGAYVTVSSAKSTDAREKDRLQWTLAALGVISTLLSVGGAVTIALNITRPITQLTKAAARIQDGDYSNPVSVPRSDEIGALANTFDHMREGIAEREQEVLRLAYRDTLTDLPNRALFHDHLEHAIDNAHRTGRPLSMLMMDLDRFKYVNDSLGHGVGDHVLREVAGLCRSRSSRNGSQRRAASGSA